MGRRLQSRLEALERRASDPSREYAERHRRLAELLDDAERIGAIVASLPDPDGETAPERFLRAVAAAVGIPYDHEAIDGRSSVLIHHIACRTPFGIRIEQAARAELARYYEQEKWRLRAACADPQEFSEAVAVAAASRVGSKGPAT